MQDPSQMGMQEPMGDPMMQQGMQQPPMPMAAPQPQSDPSMDIINRAIQSMNLAPELDEETRNKIGNQVVSDYETDKASLRDWYDKNNEWLALALLLREERTFPWKDAANVKYPLLATAAMQFSARAYPTLVPADNNVVKSRVIGYDQDGSRNERAERIAKHMSYQIMHKIPGWEEDMDRLLMIMSIVGTMFKETYKDEQGRVISKLVYPEDLVIDYYAKSVDEAFRKTKVITLTKNQYISKVRSGQFIDIGDIYDVNSTTTISELASSDKTQVLTRDQSQKTDATPDVFLAQHTYYDVDGDGYMEPVVIFVHKATGKVVRIVARYTLEGVKFNEKQEIVEIEPIEYFTDYQFLPNPDGSLYGLGFGTLLGPINEAINSLCNQLLDAGTINNLQSGFIGKGLRIQMKEQRVAPGQWIAVNATGEDLKNSIFPLPSKEPSPVLFQLMNLLIQSGNQLASVAEIFVGKMPGQNTPATTTQETVDQAMKVFTAIYKRTYRSLLREFNKIYQINRYSPEIVSEEASVLNIPIQASDYQGEADDIIPAADPSGNSSTAQFQQLQAVGQMLLPLGVINPQEYAMRELKLIQIPDPEKLILQPQPPQPDPTEMAKQETEKIKQQGMQQKSQTDAQLAQQKLQLEEQMAMIKTKMQEQEMMHKQAMQEMELQNKQQEMHMDAMRMKMEQFFGAQEGNLKVAQSQQQHQIKMTHQQQMARQKEKLAAKTKPNGRDNARKN